MRGVLIIFLLSFPLSYLIIIPFLPSFPWTFSPSRSAGAYAHLHTRVLSCHLSQRTRHDVQLTKSKGVGRSIDIRAPVCEGDGGSNTRNEGDVLLVCARTSPRFNSTSYHPHHPHHWHEELTRYPRSRRRPKSQGAYLLAKRRARCCVYLI